MNTQPDPIKNTAETVPGAQVSPENSAQVPQPEVSAPSVESISVAEVDHQSVAQQPQQVVQTATNNQPASVVDDNAKAVVDSGQAGVSDPAEPKELEKKYYDAADEVIDTLGGQPYEEEEKAEDLSQGYLHERFGKDIPKSDG